MNAPWVHVEGLDGEEGGVALSAEEVRHVASRRLRAGDAVVAFDGAGRTALARIEVLTKRRVEIELGKLEQAEPPLPGLGLATAIPKGERLSTMLPMLIQLGLDAWQPLVLADSVVRKLDVTSPRLRRILIEGCKLARRPWSMRILEPAGLERVIADRSGEAPLIYGDREGSESGLEAGAAWVFIGPEAGFNEGERTALARAGARARCFGAYNLRIETAAVAAAACHFAASASPEER